MRMLDRPIAILLCAMLAVPALPAVAVATQAPQQSIVARDDLDSALALRLEAEDEARSRVRALLRNPEVRELADDFGLDMERAESAIETLDGNELAELDAAASEVDRLLSGGAATVTISLVSLLLVLIIVILLAD